ncbi:MAG: hypothetical protein QOI38_2560, partial [Sphingomonadales bacterium]|nr:hypothetical protein [Sphingomonadales bacterium]
MRAAVALGERGRGGTAPKPNVGWLVGQVGRGGG